jgi:hypothetical protein
MNRMKKLLLSGFLVCSLFGMASEQVPAPPATVKDGIEVSENWTEYKTVDGVKIEYKMTRCETKEMRAQNRLLFKFTNTTDQALTISWVSKEFRNDQCWNCTRIENPEYAHSLTLAPGEVLEGDTFSKSNKALSIFGNYVNHVPGMSNQRLTNFELIDLSVRK